MALFDILPFGEGFAEPYRQFLTPGLAPWEQASGYQCLRLLKLLGVEQQNIAVHLGVAVSNVSMWMNKVRGTPAKYMDALRAYTAAMVEKAAERTAKEIDVLPKPLQMAACMEFYAILRRWELESYHEIGLLTKTVQTECRQVGAFADKTTLTAEDRQALRHLCSTLQIQLRTLDELETVAEDSEASSA